jgi:hypothetical protein
MRIPLARLATTMNTPGQIRSPTLLGRAHPLKKATNTPAKNVGLSITILHWILSLIYGRGLPLADIPREPYETLTSLNSKKYLE